MQTATVIRNAAWVIAWDGTQHVYLRGADVAFSGSKIVYVGSKFIGAVDQELDGTNRLVMPGLIDIHTHSATEPMNKGFRDEIRSPNFWHTPLYEFLYLINVDAKGALAAVQVAMGELLLSGVTTAVHLGQLQLGVDSSDLYEVLANTGMRVVIGPMFRDARWVTRDGHSVTYEWDVAGGKADFEKAIKAIDVAESHKSGRLLGMVCPGQIDTCTPELIADSFAFAEERNLPYQIHIGQSPTEFHEIARRTGKTPIGLLQSLGALRRRTILGHCIFADHHPWLHWSTRNDLDTIAEAGASVAHCPVEFLRRGMALRTLGGYLRRGINVAIGTDTYPHNMLEEMRMAAYAARIIGETVDDVSTSNVFHAATVGGANALLREDIGRLAVGCRADIVLVDLKHPAMMPCREPLRNLIYIAGDRAIRDVFVDGQRAVKDGKLVNIDLPSALEEVEKIQRKGSLTISLRDWAKRDIDGLAPIALPMLTIDNYFLNLTRSRCE
jgi:cytosine/adenosine deaminase-related metal-dependent hydrolase